MLIRSVLASDKNAPTFTRRWYAVPVLLYGSHSSHPSTESVLHFSKNITTSPQQEIVLLYDLDENNGVVGG